MKIFLIFIMLFFLMGCDEKTSQRTPLTCKANSQEQEGKLVYGKQFSDLMGLPEDKATLKYQKGLLAVRAYWTCMYGQNQHPLLQVQLYSDDSIKLPLTGDEGALFRYEMISYSGFKYFSGSPKYNKSDERYKIEKQKEYDGYFNRIVLSDTHGMEGQPIYRFKKSLVPGVNVIEFGTSFRESFNVFLYTGTEKPSVENMMKLIRGLKNNDEVYKDLGYSHFSLPKELDTFVALHSVSG